jgi:hypothetical protein
MVGGEGSTKAVLEGYQGRTKSSVEGSTKAVLEGYQGRTKSSGEGSTRAALEGYPGRTKSSGEGSTRAALEVDQVRTKSSGCTHSLPMPSDAPETTAHAPYFVGSTGARSTQRCTAPMTALKNAPVFRATT